MPLNARSPYGRPAVRIWIVMGLDCRKGHPRWPPPWRHVVRRAPERSGPCVRRAGSVPNDSPSSAAYCRMDEGIVWWRRSRAFTTGSAEPDGRGGRSRGSWAALLCLGREQRRGRRSGNEDRRIHGPGCRQRRRARHVLRDARRAVRLVVDVVLPLRGPLDVCAEPRGRPGFGERDDNAHEQLHQPEQGNGHPTRPERSSAGTWIRAKRQWRCHGLLQATRRTTCKPAACEKPG